MAFNQLKVRNMETTTITYNDRISRQFVAASVLFGIVGMLVGVVIALQLAWWPANVHQWLTFGRLRPLHTNAVIFAFVGNMLFAGVYYSTQRLCKARLPSDFLAQVHFWGWQLIIVAAAVTLPLGFTTGKEYAELEWPIDIAITVIWVVFAINFFWTLANRTEKHLYVALWFYIATIITIAVLHIVNSLEIPVGPLKSYSVFAGVQDALVQWWYGHNAVAFFLTTPILGIMYYFLPKAAERPVFSYRLSIIHFWSLVFLYIWAGPHHLLYTALPEWAQTLGMVFSVMLWAPSWGGMLNGLLTLRGAWDRLRTDPFSSSLPLRHRSGNVDVRDPLFEHQEREQPCALHRLDHRARARRRTWLEWVHGSGHVLLDGAAAVQHEVVFESETCERAFSGSRPSATLFYVMSMWAAGIQQGLMWRAQNSGGGLEYPEFCRDADRDQTAVLGAIDRIVVSRRIFDACVQPRHDREKRNGDRPTDRRK
ncbi:MAG: cbb3-type cytochrome c oxidase subunit I [Polyangiales bacterium]